MTGTDTARAFQILDLPAEFEDLSGLVEADLRAIVGMLATRANERLFLTRREFRDLQVELWNGLGEALAETLRPLSTECR